MTDWNPAEMIGTKPRRLAFSLYRRLITDEAWALQRVEYGYRDVRPCNLIVDVLGHPYIDVRVDFNSFVPADLDDALAERLVDHYLERLEGSPELHDKVEFDVLFTCLGFDFDAQSERLREAGFTPAEIQSLRDSLGRITRDGIARCASDVAAIADNDARFRRVMSVPLPPLERAYILLEDVRRLGIPLFSHLARHGFVAVTLLKSLRAAGCLSDEEVESFQSSLRTVPAVMQEHAYQVAKQELDWEAFVAEYGHLRPGSYDITSEGYAQATGKYLLPMVEAAEQPPPRSEGASWSEATRKSVDKALREAGFGIDCDGLCGFMAQGIEGREFGKFSFMRGVSAALEAIAEFGAQHGVSRKALAHIRVDELFALRGAATQDLHDSLTRLSDRGKEEFYVCQAACLPGQIFSEQDLESFEQVAAEPNYITRNKVRARVRYLAEGESPEDDLAGTIVVIANADPGYDWLFSREIAGLITMYGGVNSHMAIRAAEFGLPAAIGVGELLFESVSRAEMLELDCESRKIEMVR
jgi:phosphohistidine swiveling domain-containing protein